MSNFKTLNKGEWSEVYAFLRIIADKQLKGGDHNLILINEEIYSVVSIEKEQQNTNCLLSYRINNNYVEILKNDEIIKKISSKAFEKVANFLLNFIKSSKTRTFEISEMNMFLDNLLKPKLKAPSKEKKDIIITIKEPLTKTNQSFGFSIKSNLSKATSTLLNASTATNFTFVVEDNQVINTTDKAKSLVNKIKSIYFERLDNEIFNNNLQIIDTQFPKIISLILLYYYQGKATLLTDLIRIIQEKNPLNLTDLNVYRIKVGDFLLSIALGMMPKTKWNKMYNADGGMLVIKENGDIVSFLIFKQKLLNELKEYLITKSYLDTPSTTRHKFGKLYKEDNKLKIKLNLQIRLK